MTAPASTAQAPHRVRTLEQVRRYASWVLVLYTTLVALLWIVPKGDLPPIWLLCLIPGTLMVWLVWKSASPRAVRTSTLIPGLPLIIPLTLAWFAGVLLIGSGGSNDWTFSLPWTFLTMNWPLVMTLGLVTRLVARKLMPRAKRKDDHDLQQQRQADSIARFRERELEYDRRMQREMNSQSEPTAPGRFTGLEPGALAAVEIPVLKHLHGVPGAGLSGSGFGADQIAKGRAGELNFARALQYRQALARFATFWSVHMPDETVGASKELSADIDCVLVTGRRIYLLDMKNYTQGDVTWFLEDDALRLLDNPTGGYIGKPRPMSRNMELAVARVGTKFRELGIHHDVVGRVVFMPTDNGSGTISPEVRWPGEVPAVTLDQILGELAVEDEFDPEHSDSEHIVRVFRWLVKDESGSAPRLGEAWKHAPGMRRGRPSSGAADSGVQTARAPGAGTAGATAPASVDDSSSVTSAPSTPARTCVECGAEYGPDWTFCWECGRA